MLKIHYTRFPVTSPQTRKLPTCCGLVATSRCNGIWETSSNDTTQQTQRTFARASLLQTCCRLVVYVADFLRGSRQLVTDLLRENWCNGFWPLNQLNSQKASCLWRRQIPKCSFVATFTSSVHQFNSCMTWRRRCTNSAIICYISGICLLPVVAVDYFKMFGYDSNGQILELSMVCNVLQYVALSTCNYVNL